jgi:hypothetical protein
MTFNFRNWPTGLGDFPLTPERRAGRPRLVARWQRGPDGKLACRWVRRPVCQFSD